MKTYAKETYTYSKQRFLLAEVRVCVGGYMNVFVRITKTVIYSSLLYHLLIQYVYNGLKRRIKIKVTNNIAAVGNSNNTKLFMWLKKHHAE